MPCINDRTRREDRRRVAASNAEARAQRSTQAQLDLLDDRPGSSKRERARLKQNIVGTKSTRRRKRRKPTTDEEN